MFAKQICRGLQTHSSLHSPQAIRSVQLLPDATIETFRKHAFEPAQPALLPKGYHAGISAAATWFLQPKRAGEAAKLNTQYLSKYGSALLPLEITSHGEFARIENSLAFFLDAYNQTTARIYIAQASLADLPRGMQEDLPTPDLVLKAGKGDIYDSSIWLGQAPTYTPLHRDPNPNLFVQLAGKKLVRLYAPRTGNAVFSRVQEMIGGSASATMRGEEMMQGKEKDLLEQEVWGDSDDTVNGAFQAELDAGDALFIPKGWWHSVKGVGESINGSVNWWFR